jgi:solute carrier family 30 (zinc transporter), member 2
MRAAMIHLLGDLIQSVGVVIASIVVKFNPTWKLCDPICTIVFAIIVLFTTTNVVKDCIRVLMEASPNGIDI